MPKPNLILLGNNQQLFMRKYFDNDFYYGCNTEFQFKSNLAGPDFLIDQTDNCRYLVHTTSGMERFIDLQEAYLKNATDVIYTTNTKDLVDNEHAISERLKLLKNQVPENCHIVLAIDIEDKDYSNNQSKLNEIVKKITNNSELMHVKCQFVSNVSQANQAVAGGVVSYREERKKEVHNAVLRVNHQSHEEGMLFNQLPKELNHKIIGDVLKTKEQDVPQLFQQQQISIQVQNQNKKEDNDCTIL